MPALHDKALLSWVRHVSQHATWMASVCTGASIYAAAGILAGRRATTHWAFRDVLASMGVNVCPGRVVFDEPFVSGAGVSAGIDMALALTGRVHGPAVAEAFSWSWNMTRSHRSTPAHHTRQAIRSSKQRAQCSRPPPPVTAPQARVQPKNGNQPCIAPPSHHLAPPGRRGTPSQIPEGTS
jgi:transcriptional regulator GlxA family with amidase domain